MKVGYVTRVLNWLQCVRFYRVRQTQKKTRVHTILLSVHAIYLSMYDRRIQWVTENRFPKQQTSRQVDRQTDNGRMNECASFQDHQNNIPLSIRKLNILFKQRVIKLIKMCLDTKKKHTKYPQRPVFKNKRPERRQTTRRRTRERQGLCCAAANILVCMFLSVEVILLSWQQHLFLEIIFPVLFNCIKV